MKQHVLPRVLVSVLAGACLVWSVTDTSPLQAAPDMGGGHGNQSFAYPPNAQVHGHSQSYWEVKFWQWGLAQPLADHPFTDTPNYDVTEGQSGSIWFLASPVGDNPSASFTRTCTIPANKSLYVLLVGSEWSSLEGYPTEQEQRDNAAWQGDHIIPSSISCTLDGVALANPAAYRRSTAQFDFDAPSPWIFGDTGGTGSAVADGFGIVLKELDPGQHTLHFTAQQHFTFDEDGFDLDLFVNTTYNITQLGCGGGGHH
ncbi:MAG: hypothetical protein IPJ19_14670 [Planctomycetes bacterium]|nr:hypothetical protein [Planctomycetota bacterium]